MIPTFVERASIREVLRLQIGGLHRRRAARSGRLSSGIAKHQTPERRARTSTPPRIRSRSASARSRRLAPAFTDSPDATYGTLYGVTKTTVYLDSDTVLALRQMAATQGRSQADLIRAALEAYTRKIKRPKIPGIGEFHSGHTDTSEQAEEMLGRAAKRGRWR
jgi:hypothetical protein